jgi:nicotinate-nucleotide pyrophosphorylase (carboxylating)
MTEPTQQQIDQFVSAWLDEDVGRGDRTTEAVVAAGTSGRARIEARSRTVVAGLGVARACFEQAGGDVDWSPLCSDGDVVDPGTALVRLSGSLRTILTGERTALNILGRLSGIATSTRRYIEAVAGTPAQVVDTRKTTPGLRLFEKYAVRVGGGRNHRFGLDDGVLIKDNHIAAAGGVSEAVRRARDGVPHGLRVEVEARDMIELDEALSSGADAVLLDNMTPEEVAHAVTRAGGKVVLEASGGVTLKNIRAYAETGVDLISVGALTHSAQSADLALEVEPSDRA